MKTQELRSLFFYQGHYVGTILNNNPLLLMRSGRHVLATQHTHHSKLLMADTQGSTLRALVSNPEKNMAYAPYGHEPHLRTYAIPGFNGELPDRLTEYYLLGNGYRAFSPTLRRFISPDRHSPFGAGGINSFAYCLNDPVNNIDPTGRWELPWSWSWSWSKKTPTQSQRLFTPSDLDGVPIHITQIQPELPRYQHAIPPPEGRSWLDLPKYSELPTVGQSTKNISFDRHGVHRPGTLEEIKEDLTSLAKIYDLLIMQKAQLRTGNQPHTANSTQVFNAISETQESIRMQMIANYHRPILPPYTP